MDTLQRMIYEPCIILKPEMVQIAETARIDSFCKLEGGQGLTIGDHVHIASFSHLNAGGGEVIFEAHSVCASGVRVVGGVPDLSFLHISAAEPPEHCQVIRRRTAVGRYAIIFSNAVICPGVTIGEGAVVGAGAVVTKDVAPWAIVAGVPAKQIGIREISEGERLQIESLAELAGRDAALVRAAIEAKYGLEVNEYYAADLVRFVESMGDRHG